MYELNGKELLGERYVWLLLVTYAQRVFVLLRLNIVVSESLWKGLAVPLAEVINGGAAAEGTVRLRVCGVVTSKLL